MLAIAQQPTTLPPGLYAANPGADHPTPAAPDRGSTSKPKPAAKPGKKKKK
jgi:hypothetical protein